MDVQCLELAHCNGPHSAGTPFTTPEDEARSSSQNVLFFITSMNKGQNPKIQIILHHHQELLAMFLQRILKPIWVSWAAAPCSLSIMCTY